MDERVSFMEQLNSCIGPAAKLSYFPLYGLTPDFEYYADGIEYQVGTSSNTRVFVKLCRLDTSVAAWSGLGSR